MARPPGGWASSVDGAFSVLPAAALGDDVTTRRAFIGTLSSEFITAPLAAKAQPVGKVHRVGWLATSVEPRTTFRAAMRDFGYVEGKNLACEQRGATLKTIARAAIPEEETI